jgi:hypothetical protein
MLLTHLFDNHLLYLIQKTLTTVQSDYHEQSIFDQQQQRHNHAVVDASVHMLDQFHQSMTIDDKFLLLMGNLPMSIHLLIDCFID